MAGGLDIGRVGIARPGALAAAAPFAAATKTFAAGETVVTSIHYNNKTGSVQVRDAVIAFGTYNPDTGEFTPAAPGIVIGEDVSFQTGEAQVWPSRHWDIPNISGTFDVLVGLGTYDPDTGRFTVNAAEMFIKEDYIEVTAAYIEVTDFDVTSA